jgi:hypothetical protein
LSYNSDKEKLIATTTIAAFLFSSMAAITGFQEAAAQATATQGQITFTLQGTHAEHTVSEVLEKVGWNMTVFLPLQNNATIIVTAIPIQ